MQSQCYFISVKASHSFKAVRKEKTTLYAWQSRSHFRFLHSANIIPNQASSAWMTSYVFLVVQMLIARSPKFHFTDMSLYHFKVIFPGYRVQMWQFLLPLTVTEWSFIVFPCSWYKKKLIAICIIVSLFIMRVYFVLLLEDAPRCNFLHNHLEFVNLWML